MAIAIAIAIDIAIAIAMTSALAIAVPLETVQAPSHPSIPLAGAPLRPRPYQSGLPQWFTAHREGRTSYRSTLASWLSASYKFSKCHFSLVLVYLQD